jgi:threonine synthase
MRVVGLKCPRCGSLFDKGAFASPCASCLPEVSVGLFVEYDLTVKSLSRVSGKDHGSSLWDLSQLMPVEPEEAVSLGEGLTPLVRLGAVGQEFDMPHLFAKCEFGNPTGSFKDRMATSAISAARSLFEAKVIASSSTGNAGAAVAAYAAKAGMDCIIFTVGRGVNPYISQMQAYGAIVVVCSNKAQRWKFLGEGVEKYGWFPTSPFFAPAVGSNPYGLEGYKSLAYEIALSFDWSPPDWIILPVCYGDALFGVWRGFGELIDGGLIEKMPRLIAAEIYGSLSAAFQSEKDTVPEMPKTYETAATSIAALQSTYQALFTLRQTGGQPVTVSEQELLHSASLLSAREGLFVEPAAAASLSAAIALRARGAISQDDRVVCLLTAGGLKSPDFQKAAVKSSLSNFAELDQVVNAVKCQRGVDLRSPAREIIY